MDWIGVCSLPKSVNRCFTEIPVHMLLGSIWLMSPCLPWFMSPPERSTVCSVLGSAFPFFQRQSRNGGRNEVDRGEVMRSVLLVRFPLQYKMIPALHNVPLKYSKVFGLTLCKLMTCLHPPPLARKLGKISYQRQS